MWKRYSILTKTRYCQENDTATFLGRGFMPKFSSLSRQFKLNHQKEEKVSVNLAWTAILFQEHGYVSQKRHWKS